MEPTYIVSNLYLASYLMARGHAVRVVKLSPSRCEFIFPPAAEDDAGAYDEDAAISAPLYADALRRLKGLVARAPEIGR
jgi:hypothetical protein